MDWHLANYNFEKMKPLTFDEFKELMTDNSQLENLLITLKTAHIN